MDKLAYLGARTGFLFVILYAILTIFFVLTFKRPALGVALCLAISCLVYLLVFLNQIPRKNSAEFKLAVVLLVWMGVDVLLQNTFVFDSYDFRGVSAFEFTGAVYKMVVLWFVAGMASGLVEMRKSNAISFSLLGLVALAVFPNLDSTFLISYRAIAEEGFEGVNHLLVAEMVLLVGYYAYAISHGKARLLAIALVAFLAYAGGGRSSFYLGVLALFFYEFAWGGRVGRYASVVLAVLAGIVISSFLLADADDSVRRMFLVGGASQDLSFQERNVLFAEGLSGLLNQVAFGDPTLIARGVGGVGGYIHNILSVWQFFGFFPFVLSLILIVCVVLAVYRFGHDTDSCAERFGLICLAYGVVGIFTTKFVGFPYIWFGLGFWVWRLNGRWQSALESNFRNS